VTGTKNVERATDAVGALWRRCPGIFTVVIDANFLLAVAGSPISEEDEWLVSGER
jgi:hypothetical protein